MNIKNINPINHIQLKNKHGIIKKEDTREMKNDSFEKTSNKAFIKFFYNSDEAIYVNLKLPKFSEVINCMLDTDDSEPNYDLLCENVPVKLLLSAMSVRKAEDSEQDKFYQAKNGLVDTQTEIVGTVASINDDNIAKITVEGFDIPIEVLLEKDTEIKVKDKISVYGVLDCELTEEN